MESRFMLEALTLAREAAEQGEVPVGAVIVKDGVIIARGRNRREEKHSALSHAECEAIAAANEELGDWRLEGCTLYVTLEPCPMCTGAVINARISELVFGAFDRSMGAVDSVINLCDKPFGFRPQIYAGIYEDKCRALLTDFFKGVRQDKG